jgi:glycerol-3-phosphate dehydrogenase (NAD(P)+)
MAVMTVPAKKIAVVGLGAWGSALAVHCARLGHSVTAWSRDTSFVREINDTRQLKTAGIVVTIPANLKATTNLADLEDADLTIVALPASAWGEVLPHLKARTIVSATKGLEKHSSLTPLSFAHQRCGFAESSLAVLSGPSFASDLIAGRPLSVVVGSKSEQLALEVATSLSSPSLRVYTSHDPLGVELGGILKNVVAIVAGVSDSLGYGPSARAAIISRGLYEITTVAVALGAEERTLTGLSGLGDLIMTATEDQSRNRTVGLRLGKGEKLPDVIKALGSTAEGVSSAPLVLALAQKHNIPVPITEQVVRLMNGEIRATEVARALMTRPLKSEF